MQCPGQVMCVHRTPMNPPPTYCPSFTSKFSLFVWFYATRPPARVSHDTPPGLAPIPRSHTVTLGGRAEGTTGHIGGRGGVGLLGTVSGTAKGRKRGRGAIGLLEGRAASAPNVDASRKHLFAANANYTGNPPLHTDV